jgi:transcriptional regulator with XRE-family HTH domain
MLRSPMATDTDRLRALREAAHVSQSALARAMGMSRNWLMGVERGETSPRLDEAQRWAGHFGRRWVMVPEKDAQLDDEPPPEISELMLRIQRLLDKNPKLYRVIEGLISNLEESLHPELRIPTRHKRQ